MTSSPHPWAPRGQTSQGKHRSSRSRGGGRQGVGRASTSSTSTSVCLLLGPLPREQEEATWESKAGTPKPLREGGLQNLGGGPGAPLTPCQGRLSWSAGLSSLRITMVRGPAPRPTAPCPTHQVPLLSWVGGPGLPSGDHAGWLGLWGGLLGECVASSLNSGAAGRG